MRSRPSLRLLALGLALSLVLLPLAAPLAAGLAYGPAPVAAAPAAATTAAPGGFPDLEGHWAYASVALLAARGVVRGFPDGSYRPAETLTRAQFAALMVAGLEGGATAELLRRAGPAFGDVQGHWAQGWIAAARELGLVHGYDGGRFLPQEGMSRAQVAAVLVRALGWAGDAAGLGAERIAAILGGFGDAGAVPGWARAYLAIGVERGLIRGYEDYTLRPLATVTRAEAAALAARALDRMGLLFDLGGELWEVDPAGAVTLARLHGRDPDPAGRLRARTDEETAWFRNGRPAQPADLAPGDHVLLVLDQAVGPDGQPAAARLVYALAWDVLGQIAGVEPGAVVLDTGLGRMAVAIGDQTRLFRNGLPAGAGELALGDRAYALVDPLTGVARVLDAVRVEAGGELLSTGQEAGARYLVLAPGGRQVLSPGAAILVDGVPARFENLRPGLQVVLASRDPATGVFGYCEAWSAGEDLGEATPPQPGPAGPVAAAAPVGPATVSNPGGVAAPVATATALNPDLAATPAALPLLPANPAHLGLTVRATGADLLWQHYGVDGTGIRIAVVDTGVDPSLPLLQQTTGGGAKLVAWIDLSGEGRVDTLFSSGSFGGYASSRLGLVRLGAHTSRSGIFRSGVLDEGLLVGEGGQGVDLDGNGRVDDRFLVMLLDSLVAGVYDRVVVDTNADRDLRNERSMSLFAAGGGFVQLRTGTALTGVGLVVTEIDPGGRRVNLGFDANGHGSHVAGIAAGHDPSGLHPVTGMAPGAQVMAIKALRSSGAGSWSDIARAVELAVDGGAQVVVLAMEGPAGGQGVLPELQRIAAVAAERGALVFMAAGNTGPGAGTAAVTPDPEALVPVGAYLPDGVWAALYGQRPGRDTVWLNSGAGPAAAGGGTSPLLLAPAAAVSPVPRTRSPGGFHVFQGTSMAAPHAAGAAALMMQYLPRAAAQARARSVVRALAAGARPLAGVTPAEQGFGALDLLAAVRAGRPAGTEPAVDITPAGGAAGTGTAWAGAMAGPGGRGPAERQQASWRLELTATGDRTVAAGVTARRGAVTVDRAVVHLPPGVPRVVRVTPAGAGGAWGQEGVFDLLVVTDLDTGELLGHHLVHQPARAAAPSGGGPFAQAATLSVGLGSLTRHYFEVPSGATEAQFAAAVLPDSAGEVRGEAEVFLYSPGGHLVASSGRIGRGRSTAQMALSLDWPAPGLWEAVVWGAADLAGGSQVQLSLSGLGHTVAVQPGLLRRAPGETDPGRTAVAVTVTSPAGSPAAALEVLGWLPGDAGPQVTWHQGTVTGGASRIWTLAQVPPGAGLIEVSLHPTMPGDADLYLYYLDGGPGGRWVDLGASRTAGPGPERVRLWRPPAGDYAIVAEGREPGSHFEVSVMTAVWPAGTMILYGQTVPAAGAGAGGGGPAMVGRTVQVFLPLPVQAGIHRAEVVLREARTGATLASAPFLVERHAAAPVVALAPRLVSGGQAPGGPGGAPVLRVLCPVTLTPLDAWVDGGGRREQDGAGRVRLGAALLGTAAGAGDGGAGGGRVALAVGADGYLTWRGEVRLAEAPAGVRVPGAGVGQAGNPYPWAAEHRALQAALRRKALWLEGRLEAR